MHTTRQLTLMAESMQIGLCTQPASMGSNKAIKAAYFGSSSNFISRTASVNLQNSGELYLHRASADVAIFFLHTWKPLSSPYRAGKHDAFCCCGNDLVIEPKTKCEQISECRKWPLLLICCALRHLCISLLANPSNTVSNVLLSGSHACNRCRTTGNLLQHFQSHSRLCTLMRSCSRAMRTQAYTTQRHQAQCTKGLLVQNTGVQATAVPR